MTPLIIPVLKGYLKQVEIKHKILRGVKNSTFSNVTCLTKKSVKSKVTRMVVVQLKWRGKLSMERQE